jgi:hypothetical protein
MSLVFSDSATKAGLCELIDDIVGTNTASYPLIQKARDINLAQDAFLAIALQAGGKWQVDDSGHTKDPILTTDLVSGQRDYHFTVDEQSNLILDIYRVMVATSAGVFYDLTPVDQQSREDGVSMVDGLNATSTPTQYDKTANGIYLDPIPNYDYTSGLKLFINREAYYFVAGDDTRKPGFVGLFHEYFAIAAAYRYATRHGLAIIKQLQSDILLMEQKIADYYGQRAKDERPVLKGKFFNFK